MSRLERRLRAVEKQLEYLAEHHYCDLYEYFYTVEPFRMTIEDIHEIQGRGVVLVGKGCIDDIQRGDQVELNGNEYTLSYVERMHRTGLVLRGLERKDVEAGQTVRKVREAHEVGG
jgi:translation elongation factor EF-Tu-like GTPase